MEKSPPNIFTFPLESPCINNTENRPPNLDHCEQQYFSTNCPYPKMKQTVRGTHQQYCINRKRLHVSTLIGSSSKHAAYCYQ